MTDAAPPMGDYADLVRRLLGNEGTIDIDGTLPPRIEYLSMVMRRKFPPGPLEGLAVCCGSLRDARSPPALALLPEATVWAATDPSSEPDVLRTRDSQSG